MWINEIASGHSTLSGWTGEDAGILANVELEFGFDSICISTCKDGVGLRNRGVIIRHFEHSGVLELMCYLLT